MVQFLSIKFFSWISSIFVGFFKSSRFLCHPVERNVETKWRHSWFILRDCVAVHSATTVKRLLVNRSVVDFS